MPLSMVPALILHLIWLRVLLSTRMLSDSFWFLHTTMIEWQVVNVSFEISMSTAKIWTRISGFEFECFTNLEWYDVWLVCRWMQNKAVLAELMCYLKTFKFKYKIRKLFYIFSSAVRKECPANFPFYLHKIYI